MKKTIFMITLALACMFAQAQVIDPLLQEEMNRRTDSEMIEITVLMKSRCDRNMLNQRASALPTRAERRAFVVDELKHFTEVSQRDLKLSLAEMEQQGEVTAPRTLWMSNSLYFSATKETVLALSKRDDIAHIGYNIERKWIEDDEKPTPANETREITPNILKVNADKVWELGFTGQGIVVSVIDAGVNYNHLDLADHLWDGGEAFPHHGYDVRNDDDDPMDDMGHGTHCAGTVAGIAALMLSKNPELSPADICRILEETSVKLTPTKSNLTGCGRVDALAAVDAVEAYDGLDEGNVKANIYPNPTKDVVNIECEGMTNVKVFSMDGKLVKVFGVNGSQCKIDDLESGIYLIVIETDRGASLKKIVKL